MADPSPTVRAVLTDPEATVVLGERPLRTPGPDELVVRVAAFSLNRGEVRFAPGKPAGTPIGWDFAGVVDTEAARGEGPTAGTRVVGFSRRQEAWAERVVVPATDVAPLPEEVDDGTAAALPVAAGTALACIEAGPALLGRRALVTGVTGGVGGFAVRLARLAGALVTAQVRRDDQAEAARRLGADEVVVTDDGAALTDAHGPFHLVADGVGGSLLRRGIERLHPDGVAVAYGVTGAPDLSLPIGTLLGKGRARVRGLNLYAVSERVPPAEWLGQLVRLVAAGRLEVDATVRGPWTEVAQACADLVGRRFEGKAVLTVAEGGAG